ncbi:hypothetical protein KSW81_008417 [Nannochloris sp. 'desiccata']|nr:hypothetical protein KSW81_008417 [Chlorella desiccata (nom. nud.)]
MCRCTPPDGVGRRRAQHLAGEQVGAQRAPGPARADGKRGGEVLTLDDAALDARGEPQRHRGDIAPRHRNAARAREVRALATAVGVHELGQAVRPRAVVLASVENAPSRRRSRVGGLRRSRARWSRGDSWAAISPEAPCGSASTTMSWPASASTVVSTKVRWSSDRRCGCTSMSVRASVRVGGDRANLELRVVRHEAQHLAPRVAARARPPPRNRSCA